MSVITIKRIPFPGDWFRYQISPLLFIFFFFHFYYIIIMILMGFPHQKIWCYQIRFVSSPQRGKKKFWVCLFFLSKKRQHLIMSSLIFYSFSYFSSELTRGRIDTNRRCPPPPPYPHARVSQPIGTTLEQKKRPKKRLTKWPKRKRKCVKTTREDIHKKRQSIWRIVGTIAFEPCRQTLQCVAVPSSSQSSNQMANSFSV